jgi:hypothetical protein
MKVKFFLKLIKRDGGFKCFYCRHSLETRLWIYEHLDNNPKHSNIENLVLACQSCNVKKKDDFDMQLLALEKLKQNQNSNFVYERENETQTEFSNEIDINIQNFEITCQYLAEIIQTDGSIEYKDAVSSAAMLCKKKTGHGSTQSVREYINMLTSREGSFEIIKDDSKKRIIVNRTGN